MQNVELRDISVTKNAHNLLYMRRQEVNRLEPGKKGIVTAMSVQLMDEALSDGNNNKNC